jgi:hypothetical protein
MFVSDQLVGPSRTAQSYPRVVVIALVVELAAVAAAHHRD